jgi:putative ABC transport system permease protein
MPRLVAAVLAFAPKRGSVPFALAAAQLQGTPRQSALSCASIVASFSLMVAMLVMVSSFRSSVEDWLERMLPADLYLHANGDAAFFTPEEQASIARLPGVARVDFMRSQRLLLAEGWPPIVLLARPTSVDALVGKLPMRGATIVPGADAPPPIWVSEVAAGLYGFRVGDQVRLPLANPPPAFTVAGIWRDYARQTGAVALDRDLYTRITGDRLASDVAIAVAPGASLTAVATQLRERFGGSGIEITSNAELRAASLATFDRAFAITYALEAAAILIGLFGVSVSFSAQVLARRRTMGMLRHIGMTRGQIGGMLAVEGAVIAAIGAVAGLGLGLCESLILVHVVNRQSFHWSMDLSIPAPVLALLTLVLIGAATITAVLSGRRAMGNDVVEAVREDW